MKRVIKYVSEMSLALILIFVSYFVWDKIDVEAYEKIITQYTLDDVAINVENNFNKLVYVSDESNVESTVLTVNNYQEKEYNVNILLELDGVSDDIVDNLVLIVDDNHYNLNDINTNIDNDKYYFLITNVDLEEYEKKSYNLKLLINDNYEFSNLTGFSYNIIEKIV